jgi:hypothetical protein
MEIELEYLVSGRWVRSVFRVFSNYVGQPYAVASGRLVLSYFTDFESAAESVNSLSEQLDLLGGILRFVGLHPVVLRVRLPENRIEVIDESS